MLPMVYVSRNHALGFAARTRKNLKYIEEASDADADVHVVTQLANSLLGLIVFPWERNFVERVKTLKLDELAKQGWPQWVVTKGTCDTLGQLVEYLRHAVAHGNMTFSSDSRFIDEISIHVANYGSSRATTPNWSARIGAGDLRAFCLNFINLLEETIG